MVFLPPPFFCARCQRCLCAAAGRRPAPSIPITEKNNRPMQDKSHSQKTNRKLVLHKDTLRALDSVEARKVVGGRSPLSLLLCSTSGCVTHSCVTRISTSCCK